MHKLVKFLRVVEIVLLDGNKLPLVFKQLAEVSIGGKDPSAYRPVYVYHAYMCVQYTYEYLYGERPCMRASVCMNLQV